MNTIDRRRRIGPPNAVPLYFPAQPSKVVEKSSKDEKLFIQVNNIPTATGSSFIQSGNNILLASVYGPRPSFKRTFNDKAVLKVTFHSSPFLTTRNDPYNNNFNARKSETEVDPDFQIIDSVVLSTLETACANLIVLDQYPKSNIEIFVNLINTDNKTTFIQLLPLIHNSVNLALVDSGIALKNFPTACVTKDNVFINSIHSNVYSSDFEKDLENEELLALYVPKLNIDNETHLKDCFKEAIKDTRELRAELSQFFFQKL